MRGIRSLAVARQEMAEGGEGGALVPRGPWRMLGLLTFLDPPRPDTRHTIERALEFGVDVKMITGDHVRGHGRGCPAAAWLPGWSS